MIDEKSNLHTYFKLKETKTGKNNKIIMTKGVQKALKAFIKDHFTGDLDEFLFKSRKGDGPINRKSAWRIIGEAAKSIEMSMKNNFSTYEH